MISDQRHLFDIDQDVTYLNMAYMSPLLHSALEVGIESLKWKSKPYNIKVDDFFAPVQKVKESAAGRSFP